MLEALAKGFPTARPLIQDNLILRAPNPNQVNPTRGSP
jgi:hypothetical protein